MKALSDWSPWLDGESGAGIISPRILDVEPGRDGEAVLRWDYAADVGANTPSFSQGHEGVMEDLLLLLHPRAVPQTEVVDFAERHGPLFMCEHRLPFTHGPDCAPTEAEPISAWVGWAEVLQAARDGESVPAEAGAKLYLPVLPAADLVRLLARGGPPVWKALAAALPEEQETERRRVCEYCLRPLSPHPEGKAGRPPKYCGQHRHARYRKAVRRSKQRARADLLRRLADANDRDQLLQLLEYGREKVVQAAEQLPQQQRRWVWDSLSRRKPA